MNDTFFSTQKKIGILGGGQLGKMFLQCTRTWDIYTKVLDPDIEAPAKISCNQFVHGSFNDFDTVYNFGLDCDIITIEIEHVNIEALLALEKLGKKIHPSPQSLMLIKDKGLQKDFYVQHGFPTSAYKKYENAEQVIHAIQNNEIKIPFVQKSRTGGYDGKGVHVVHSPEDIEQLLTTPCIVEQKIDIQTEIAIIAARNENGEIACYDAVSMEFDAQANLLDVLVSPANIEENIQLEAKEIARTLIEKMNIVGLLAVEFFLDKNNTLYINEVAPRPHNSGHQSIEGNYTSQYQQHLRAILNMPLGSTKTIMPSVMVNLIGKEHYTGNVYYEGIESLLKQEGVFVHLYGKKITKPFRKMGHVTIVNKNIEEAKKIASWVKQQIQVISK